MRGYGEEVIALVKQDVHNDRASLGHVFGAYDFDILEETVDAPARKLQNYVVRFSEWHGGTEKGEEGASFRTSKRVQSRVMNAGVNRLGTGNLKFF